MKIRDLVEVEPQPTVVRLDLLNEDAEARWISEGYYVTQETEKHFSALRSLLKKKTGSGVFLIGHYGSGKSHFLAYLTQQIRAGSFVSRGPDVVPISLLNFKATDNLEAITERALGVTAPEQDRRDTWGEISKRHPKGLLIAIDELSEFLRSKPSQHSFNEDIRFLQFLGEWSQEHALWTVAALQEQIEHAGDIEYDLFRKIKDRYPIRLILTPAHVKSLIAEKILRKKPGYRNAAEQLARDLKEVFPGSGINFSDFCEVYPIHPATLDLLEEVRDRFSQARGVVDFVLTRLLGDEARGVSPFLDREWGHLISPDVIVDHFQDLLDVQPEFQGIAQKVFPYYRKHMTSLFEKKPQQELAWRLLKLLVLAHLAPARKGLDLKEAAEWLLFKVSSVDPKKNVEVVQRVLGTMAKQGAYVKEEGPRYKLDLEDDSRQSLERLMAKTIEELKGRGEAVLESLTGCLQSEDFNPFRLPRDRWHTRKVRWHFHDREVQIFFGGGQPPEPEILALQIGLPWGPPAAGIGCFRITPKQIELNGEILELAALLQLKDRPLTARVLERVEERIAGRRSWFAQLLRAAYSEITLMNESGTATAAPLNTRPVSLDGWLNGYSEWVLRQTYPQFEKFAPGHGPLPKEAYRQFMKQATESDLCAESAPEYVKLIREAYLVPMGLMQRRGFEYSMNAKLDQHDLVALLMPILEHQPSVNRIYEHLSAPVYGLVQDQIGLLLVTLLIMGEIDILKGGKSYRDSYDTLPNPIQYDRVVPGRALNLNQIRDLETLAEGFGVRTPKQWSVMAQRRIVDQLRKTGRQQRDQASQFLVKLKAHGDAGELAAEVETFIEQWLALEKGAGEIQAFQHFMFAAGSARGFVVKARELSSLPDRFERLLRETERYRHLFGYPCVARCVNPDVQVLLERLGQPPSLANSEAVSQWLDRARDVYQVYQGWYRAEHEQWWEKINGHEIWSYRRPKVVTSKHLVIEEMSRQIDMLLSKAEAERCKGLVSLEFQPMCRCGFDGSASPIAEAVEMFDSARARLEESVAMFFGQDQVKSRVKQWVDQGVEINERTLSYLEGKAVYPEIENVTLFDQHLSGLELVHTVDDEALMEILGDRIYERRDLDKALDRLFERFGPRLSIKRGAAAPKKVLIAWCVEQSLRNGIALPSVFSLAERKLMAEMVNPLWVGEAALASLEELGLGDDAVNRVLEMILDGRVSVRPDGGFSGVVGAALELLEPSEPATAADLARRIGSLYSHCARFMEIRPKEWLSRLNRIANARLEPEPPRLTELLKANADCQWIVIDCFGAALVDTVKESLADCLPHWKLADSSYGLVSAKTNTDAFYTDLLEAGVNKPFEKLDAVDSLLHSRNAAPGDFIELARAEIDIGLKRVARKLDQSKPLLIFGDHGYRVSANGRSLTHGGGSTLERLSPVLRLDPY